ncbi:MAG: HAD-IC family P-type ATPase [Acidimicrobiales bacterium]
MTSSATGLTSVEADDRRRRGLGNEDVPSTSRPLSQIVRTNVLTRFNAILGGLLVLIIVVGPVQDGLFGLVLVLNTVIGVGQELRAKRTLDHLALLSAPQVHVRRDGRRADVAVGDLVVGDVVEVVRGDQIPLDGIVLDGSFEIDESLLSGESDPVAAEAGRAVMSGSFVVAGSGSYEVQHVGGDSYAQRLSGEARRFTLATSELRDGVNRFLQLVQWAVVPVGGLLVFSQLTSNSDVPDAVRGFVAGVTAMIPEGLVLLTSVAFAIGALRLARRRVLVQELPAVEGLARVDVLCLDKTGTLTMGGIEVDAVERVAPEGDVDVDAVLGALVAIEADPNPTLAAIATGHPPAPGWEVAWASPFSSARRWSAADFGPRGVWILGAPDRLGHDTARVQELAARGMRVVLLGRVASRPDPDPTAVTPVALVSLSERVRPDAAETLARFGAQGVTIKVLSGDHPMTVAAIAREVGVPGADAPVDASACSDEELGALIGDRSVFGRVAPQQKRLMVSALRSSGHTVAMTGDGVNDVLALKEADIGVAMGSGSAVSRGVAQLILLDDAFEALVPVIAEGRRVIANVERVANLFITKTVYATLIAVAIGVTGLAYPFLPRHLTVVGNLTIGTPAFILALQRHDDPFRPGFVGRVVRFAVPCGVVTAVAALVAYSLAEAAGRPLLEQRTVATLVVAACSLIVLSTLARPMDAPKGALVVLMASVLTVVLGVSALRNFFALQLPPTAQVIEAVVIVGVAWPLLEIAGRLSRRDH